MTSTGMISRRATAARDLLRLACILLIALGFAGTAVPQSERVAVVLHIDGAIGPATADYLERSLTKARERGAAIVVLRMDTPGGLDTSMREMIREIIASPVPVAAYVSPGGARAASAGTYILYASHIAAMAPGTNLGAATPVQIGGMPGQPDEGPPTNPAAKDDKARAPPAGSKMEAKAINDAVAYIRGLARLRDRNADWAESAVREAASLEAEEALRLGVIDVVARDVNDVLAFAEGRTVTIAGSPVVLRTQNLAIEDLRPDWRSRLLGTITNPNVALLLMMIGIYGLIFEFMNPGALYPGAIGAVSLLLGLYALAVLPVSYAGVALILMGIALMVAEGFTPSFGALGIGGAVAFVLGGVILIDTDIPGFGVSIPFLAGIAVATLAFSVVVVRLALRSHRRKVVSGREEMIGARGVVQDWADGAGHVYAHSERWRAVSAAPLKPGERVRIAAIDGLTLTVSPEDNPPDAGVSDAD